MKYVKCIKKEYNNFDIGKIYKIGWNKTVRGSFVNLTFREAEINSIFDISFIPSKPKYKIWKIKQL